MQDSIFREYDIRGKIGSEFPISQAYDLARAIALYLSQKNPALKTFAIGMDGRISSPELKEKIVTALQDCGFNVIFVGVCPSPVVYFALYQLPVDAGLMITASHNPKEYNGIKISLGTKMVWGKEIKQIGQMYAQKQFAPLSITKGSYTQYPLITDYINWLRDHFKPLIGMPLSFVVDSGNGTGGTVLPQLVAAMNWPNVILQCVEVDGNYPNHEPDPTVQKNMADVKMILATTHAVLGVGLDGDGDRMAAMTKAGFLVPGDQLLAVFAQEVLKQHPHSAVVCDVKASAGLLELLQKWGARPVMCPCGHAIIKECMAREHALLGGELSCHFFFADHYFGYDDGIYAMMRLLEILHMSGKSLDELIKIFPKKYSSREFRIACTQHEKTKIIADLKNHFASDPAVRLLMIDGIRVTWPYGWALVRPSNTQPMLSMRFEGNSAQDLERIKQDFIELLSSYFDAAFLQKELL